MSGSVFAIDPCYKSRSPPAWIVRHSREYLMSAVGRIVSRFDLHELFGDLAEQERIKGHHSPEGRSIRTLARALSAWSTGGLADEDAAVLCRQAMEDWLKARLKVSQWSERPFAELIARASQNGLITRREAYRLRCIDKTCSRFRRGRGRVKPATVRSAFEFCARFLERRW